MGVSMKILVRGISLALASAILASSAAQVSFATSTSVVVGSLKSVDGQSVAKVNISFAEVRGTTIGNSTFTETDSQGRFVVQIPTGSYRVYVRSSSSINSKCLNTSFLYQVLETRQELNILTPQLQTYSFTFVGSDPSKIVGSINPYFVNVQYESIENPGLGKLAFSCDRANLTNQPLFTWQAFKISDEQKKEQSSGGRYYYQGATGQRIDTQLPDGWWRTPNVIVELPTVPTIEINKFSLKFSNEFVSGTAKFTESLELSEFGLDRKFNVRFRETVRGQLRPWRSFHPRFALRDNGLIQFRVPAGLKGLSKLEIVLIGNDFAAQSNLVTTKLPQR
jgi:hypothetical protein